MPILALTCRCPFRLGSVDRAYARSLSGRAPPWGGCALPERRLGTLYVKGPSVMSGYFGDPESTGEALSAEGWLNTGDLGYGIGNRLVITGRQKDLIIINGRNIWPQDLELLAEQQPEVRSGDALAFAAPAPGGEDRTMLVVQCREADPRRRRHLVARLQRLVREELGIDCTVALVPLHTLPRTSSGKLSRSKARLDLFARQAGTPAAKARTARAVRSVQAGRHRRTRADVGIISPSYVSAPTTCSAHRG